MLLGEHHTPRKRKRSTPPASTEKQRVTANSVQRSEVHDATCSQRGSTPGEVQQTGAEKDEAHVPPPPTSVQRSSSPKVKRQYTKRGTAGTFKGKRPPKDPEKLERFLKAKAAYEKEKMELRKSGKTEKTKRPTPTQEDYRAWQRTYNRAQSASSRESFIRAAAEWQKKKAEQVTQDAVVLPSR